ncbi:MAG: DNA mismatch repair protein MutS [Candidatus Cardinium sp.]|nr:DNA mismatch repair protein MutS [Candidatus Cardinium sp.]
MSKPIALTPLMRQYLAIKKQYPHTLLLFRVGDFYETFLEDAVKASKILGIVLTKRSNGSAAGVDLAGFPYHSLDLYLPKLVKAGCRVAICDQLEDPKQAKGIVQRGVTELVTPGLSFHDAVLDKKSNNYLAAIAFGKKLWGVSFLDLSTGEFFAAEGSRDYVRQLLQRFAPAEVLFNKKQQSIWDDFAQNDFAAYGIEEWVFQLDYAYDLLNTHFGTLSLKGFGMADYATAPIAAGAILYYLAETEHKETKHITAIVRLDEQQYVWLDPFTIKALELLVPQQPNGTALIDILDQTVTPMGARLLKKWLLFPLKEVSAIQQRLDTVAHFVNNPTITDLLVDTLKQIGDLERLIAKVAVGRVNPRELIALSNALAQLPSIQKALQQTSFSELAQWSIQFHDCQTLVQKIQHTIEQNPPLLTNQGGIIKQHVQDQLDRLRAMVHTGKDYLVQLQQKESQRTHIPSLKVAYNRVFGYYLEVPHAHQAKVPTDWIRKQTLSNAERYITEELKQYEENILNAAEQAQLLEQQLYQALVEEAAAYMLPIQQNAKLLAELDLYLSFARQACAHCYSKPIVEDSALLLLQGSRHPVIEQRLPVGTSYVPNDVCLDQTDQQIMVITGPNMAGKSALLRQVALTVLMAQIGSFVPATFAQIGLVDKLFTRVGASDNLAQGESTFMMEMTETASIMHNLSDRSLLLMDEIGRGTSTYDGMAIAWALVEYLHNHPHYKARTLFATHYHELSSLAEELPAVKNYTVTVEEIAGKILFLHKLIPGSSAHSFGIHVAQMAGMPLCIVERATLLLQQLSTGKERRQLQEKREGEGLTHAVGKQPQEGDAHLHQLEAVLAATDIDALTPLDALLTLRDLKSMLKK